MARAVGLVGGVFAGDTFRANRIASDALRRETPSWNRTLDIRVPTGTVPEIRIPHGLPYTPRRFTLVESNQSGGINRSRPFDSRFIYLAPDASLLGARIKVVAWEGYTQG